MYQEQQYLDGIKYILENGVQTDDRTGVGTVSVFRPPTMRFNIDDGMNFPLFTHKKVNFNPIIRELIWFLSSSTNINDLDSSIWNEWADEDGNIGPMYGEMFRAVPDHILDLSEYFDNPDMEAGTEIKVPCIPNWCDPLQELINGIKSSPNSRRHVMTLWNTTKLPRQHLSPQDNVKQGYQALANCHGTVIQFNIQGDKISLATYQRSADFCLGVPFNIASYAALLLIVARITGYKAHELIYDFGDAHIYLNHYDGVKEILSRDIQHELPSLHVPNFDNIEDFKFEDFELFGYEHQPAIKFPIAV